MKKVTIVIKFSDLSIFCFKISVGKEFSKIQNILLLSNEKIFKDFLIEEKYISIDYDRNKITLEEHNDELNNKAFFSPFDYGIIFIDFSKKEIFSNNNYCDFLETSFCTVSDLFKDLINDSDFINQKDYNYQFNIYEYNGNNTLVDSYLLFKDFHDGTKIFFNLYHNFLNGGRVEIRKGDNKDLILTYKNIEPIELIKLLSNYIIEDENIEREKICSIENMINNYKAIAIIPKDWIFYQNDGRYEDISQLYEILSKDIEFTKKEKDFWKKYIGD